MGYSPPKGNNEINLDNAAFQDDPDLPFVVRDKKAILRGLGNNSLPLNFTAIPIMNNFIERFAIFSDNRCPFVHNKIKEILSDNYRFTEKQEFIDEISSILEVAFDLPEKELRDADLTKLVDLCDIKLY